MPLMDYNPKRSQEEKKESTLTFKVLTAKMDSDKQVEFIGKLRELLGEYCGNNWYYNYKEED